MELDKASLQEKWCESKKREPPCDTSSKLHSMEPRRRPLRTYSKRALTTESTEPAPKRQCIVSSPLTSSKQEEEISLSPSQSKHSVKASPATTNTPLPPPIKKGTITAYFGKLLPQPQTTIPSSEPLSEPTEPEPTTTPPSSPPTISTRKKRVRRLKTRVILPQQITGEDGEKEEDTDAIGSIQDIKSPSQACPSALSEVTCSTLNRTESTPSTGAKESKSREKGLRDRKKASVQTTLSLSMNETGYTECIECDMLYNHLDKTDVRYHARHHAALVKARAQAVDKNTIDG